MELPDEAVATDVIGAFTEQHDGPPLIGMVCVVDAVHLLDDLHRDDYVALRDADSGVAAPLTARTLLTVMQIEYASTIVFVGWEALPTDEARDDHGAGPPPEPVRPAASAGARSNPSTRAISTLPRSPARDG
ncbi:MAG: hypothetical protein R2692_06370 [Microbacterium sp.]